MYIVDLALNNLQWVICHKTQPNQSKPGICPLQLLQRYKLPHPPQVCSRYDIKLDPVLKFQLKFWDYTMGQIHQFKSNVLINHHQDLETIISSAIIVYNLLAFDRNTWNHITVCKQIMIIIKWKSLEKTIISYLKPFLTIKLCTYTKLSCLK